MIGDFHENSLSEDRLTIKQICSDADIYIKMTYTFSPSLEFTLLSGCELDFNLDSFKWQSVIV